jgi:hypothetical protein
MLEPDIDPPVKVVVEDRAHAINQMIMDAQLTKTPFPGEDVQSVIKLSVADNAVRYLCYYVATLVDLHFEQAVELKRRG